MVLRSAQVRNICLRCELLLFQRTAAARSASRPSPFHTELSRRFYASQSAWETLEQLAAGSNGPKRKQTKQSKTSTTAKKTRVAKKNLQIDQVFTTQKLKADHKSTNIDTLLSALTTKEEEATSKTFHTLLTDLETKVEEKNAKIRNSGRPGAGLDEFLSRSELLSWSEQSQLKEDGPVIKESGDLEERSLQGDPEAVHEGTITESGPQSQGTDERNHAGSDRPNWHLSRRQRLVESKQLGWESLGEKTHTLILRQQFPGANMRRRAFEDLGETPTDGAAADPGSPVQEVSASIAERLAEQRVSLKEQAYRNIDELRPSGTTILTDSNFGTLKDILVSGFTFQQLREYVDEYNVGAREHHEPKYPWIQSQSEWHPIKRYQAKIPKPKEQMALKLMRDCWKLDIREYLDGIGGVEIKVGNRVLKLLFRDESKLLDDIRRDYLGPGEQIQVIHAERRVHIFARKAKTETILEKFNDVAKAIETATFPTRWISKTPIDEAILEELGRITDTCVNNALYKGEAAIRVAWLQDGEAQENLETRGQVILRLLYTALGPQTNKNFLPNLAKYGPGTLIPAVSGQEAWSWKDKLMKWSRLVLPTGTNLTMAEEKQAVTNDTLRQSLPFPLSVHHRLELIPETNEGWGRPYFHTTATFGHVLHSVKSHTIQKSLIEPQDSRMFSPVSPPPSSFQQLDTVVSNAPATATMVFRFQHHPVDKAYVQGNPPRLELHVKIPQDLPQGIISWDTCEARLFAVQESCETDIMYPAGPVDVRMTQSKVSELAPDVLRERDDIRTFITTSQLDIRAGEFRTPRALFARIPGFLISNRMKEWNPGFNKVGTQVKYLFAGLEIHRSIEAAHEGHKLGYSTIVAGSHGGQRAELTLEALPPIPSSTREEHEAYAQKYVALVHDIALGKLVSWIGEKQAPALDAAEENTKKDITSRESAQGPDIETSTHSATA